MCFDSVPTYTNPKPRFCELCGKALSYTPPYGKPKFDKYTGQPLTESGEGWYACPDYSTDMRGEENGHTHEHWKPTLRISHRSAYPLDEFMPSRKSYGISDLTSEGGTR